jgi:hypothetical protein
MHCFFVLHLTMHRSIYEPERSGIKITQFDFAGLWMVVYTTKRPVVCGNVW